jgi:hypothetical protein
LVLKLSGEGYSVWCDRVQLLGGESYPKDIQHALRERTFRVLSLLSRASIEKDNPLKERTLAVNIGKERKQEFVIPLNLDGLRPEELPWQMADLTNIAFHHGWAAGLAQLLKKLRSVDAPRTFTAGRDSVRQYMHDRNRLSGTPEQLWSNLLSVSKIPHTVLRISLAERLPDAVAATWIHWNESERVVGAFEGPPGSIEVEDLEEVPWFESDDVAQRRIARDVVTTLLREGLRHHCLAKGLRESADGEYLYFPPDLVAGNRLRFSSYDDDRTFVNAVGERGAYTGIGTERFRHHLALQFRPSLRLYGRPVIQVRNRVYLTDLAGRPLEGIKLVRRRKLLCRDWWNHQWLSRLLASVTFLGDEQGEIALTERSTERVVIAARPITLTAPDGIDEAAARAVPEVDDEAIIDETGFAPGDTSVEAPDA